MKVLLCFWPGHHNPIMRPPNLKVCGGGDQLPFSNLSLGSPTHGRGGDDGTWLHSEMRNWESQLVLDFTCHEEGIALQIEDERITKLVMKSWMKTPCDFYDVKVLCDRSTRWTGSSQSLARHQWRDGILDLALRLWRGGPAGCFRRTWWI